MDKGLEKLLKDAETREKTGTFIPLKRAEEMCRKARAYLIGTVIELGVSLLLGAIMIGETALPAFYSVSTGSFDTYTVLLWGLTPLITVAAFLTAMYNRAKYAYSLGGAGGL